MLFRRMVPLFAIPSLAPMTCPFCPSQSARIARCLGRLALILILVVGLWPAAGPRAEPAEFNTRARFAAVMDAETGALLYQRNADELMPPASMSKLMTLALLFKALKSGQVKGSDEIVMSVNAWRKGGAPSGTAAMMVPVNTKAHIDEILQGIIVQSGNDACIAVAESLGGSEEAFAKLMTAEARRIGLKKSTFRNATGLYDPEHLMTARELAELARFIIKEYPEYYPIFGQKEFHYRTHKFFNRNPLLSANMGADGLKTGYIKESGYGVVGSAVQDGRRLIVVLAGLTTSGERKTEAAKLLDFAYKGFARFKVFNAGEVVGQARVWGGDAMYVPLVGKSDIEIWLPRTPANPRLRAEIIYKYPLKTPIKQGDEVARLRVIGPTKAETEVPLVAGADVHAGGLVRRGFDTIVHLAFRWVTL
jgi:serine-type D-Ala-D-Ala carboxypeptidase (penicillin-binding protein 5/6)